MCRPRSAIALPSQAGGGQRSTAASDAAADAVRLARHVQSALCSRSPKPNWRGAAQQGSIRCRRRRVAIARDEQATCHLRSAVALPRRTGGGQLRTAATSAAADAMRSRETSTPCVVRALQSLSPAALAENSAARKHRVPAPAQREQARPARPVPSALCSRSPQLSWLRAAPHGSIGCRRRRAAITQDDHVMRRPRSAVALPSSASGGPCR